MERLDCFEKMLGDVVGGYRRMLAQMDGLKAQGKEKTVTFRQLMGNKLTYQTMLSMYQSYGLIESKDWRGT